MTDTLMITAKLRKKYDNKFNFFQVKSINDIVYDHTIRITTISFKDVVTLMDCNQYLKRFYFLVNKSNRKEIEERIKILAQFYHNNLVLKYEYPTMIITNIKDIMLKRLRRMKKMVANQNSSDMSDQEQQSQPKQIKSEIVLKSFESEKQKDDQAPFFIEKLVFQQSSFHCIFGNNVHDEQSSDQNKQNDPAYESKDKKPDISHLICDFDELDTDYVFAIYKKAVKKVQEQKIYHKERIKRKIGMNQVNCKLDNKYSNQDKQQKKQVDSKLKPPNSSIVITPLDYEQLKTNKKNTTIYSPRYISKNNFDAIRQENGIKQQHQHKPLYTFETKTYEKDFNKLYSRRPFVTTYTDMDNHLGISVSNYNSAQKWKSKFCSHSPKIKTEIESSARQAAKINSNKIAAIKQKAINMLKNAKHDDKKIKIGNWSQPKFYDK